MELVVNLLDNLFGKKNAPEELPVADEPTEADKLLHERINQLESGLRADIERISKNHETLMGLASHIRVASDCQKRLENLEASFKIVVDGHNKLTTAVNETTVRVENMKGAITAVAEAVAPKVTRLERVTDANFSAMDRRLSALEKRAAEAPRSAKKAAKPAKRKAAKKK